MPDLDILNELISDDTLVRAGSDANGKSVLVLEERSAEPAYAVTIRNVPAGTLAVKADNFPPPAFKGNNGERKRADFVVFAWTTDGNWIIYVEMKGGRAGSEAEIVQQLMGAQCIVAYCQAYAEDRRTWKE